MQPNILPREHISGTCSEPDVLKIQQVVIVLNVDKPPAPTDRHKLLPCTNMMAALAQRTPKNSCRAIR